MADGASIADRGGIHPAATRDAFYDGRLTLMQPAKGHRAGTDAILLAGAVPRDFSGLCLDVGSGVGAAGLGIALLCPAARVRLVEKDGAIAALAEANIAANGLGAKASVTICDVLQREARRPSLPDRADLVVTNPPFYDPGTVRATTDENRRAAHVLSEGATLEDWILACLDLLAAKGTLIMIHAAFALPEILAAFDRRFGAVTIMGVHPRDGEPAKRVLVRGVKGSRAPFTMAPPLVLHEGAGFGDRARRLHTGEMSLDW